MVTAFLNCNYDVLWMWLDYKAINVLLASKLNGSFIFTLECRSKFQHEDHISTFESLCFIISILTASHAKLTDITINGEDDLGLLISGFSM